MSLRIGIGLGIPFGNRGGVDWSASNYVSALSVLTTSDTTQTITAMIVGTDYDGVSFEYSDDNGTTWSAEITDADGILNQTGLTTHILYLWRARLYKGINYSPYSNLAGGICSIIIESDNFTGIVTDALKWIETDPDSRISQSDKILLECDHSANITEFTNKLVSVNSILSGVAVVQGHLSWDNASNNEALGGIYLYKDNNNYASITSRVSGLSSNKLRLIIKINNVAVYSLATAITQNKHVKIWTDGTDIKFYYWNVNTWTQLGTTQTFSLGYPLLCCFSFTDLTTFTGANPIYIDHAYLSNQDYLTKDPNFLEILSAGNSAYCWFTTPKAVYNSDKTFIGLVHNSGGGYTQHIATLINSTGTITFVQVGAVVSQDDHGELSILIRAADNKLFIAYSEHNLNDYVRFRISNNALDASAWEAESTFEAEAHVSYASSFQASNGDIYIFYRENIEGYCYIKSTDGGAIFSGRTLFFFGFSIGGYAKFKQSPLDPDIIHVVISSVHPQNAPESSAYAFYFDCSDDKFYRLDGTETTANIPFDAASDMTLIMQNTAPDNGWIEDLTVDSTGKPRYLITFFPDGDDVNWLTKDLYYAEWDGSAITPPHKIHTAAERTIGGVTAPTYMPNSCFKINNPDVIIASKDTDGILELYKIIRIASNNFLSIQLTKNSLIDFWRPFTTSASQRNLFFLEKTSYVSYTNFSQSLVTKTI